jgi:hypothetical protein
MAISVNPSDGFQVTVAAAGTAIALTPAVFDNTHTVLVFNGSANIVFLRWQTTNAAITGANGTLLAAGASVTLGVGPLSARPWDGSSVLWADASVNGTVFNVTYVNGLSS